MRSGICSAPQSQGKILISISVVVRIVIAIRQGLQVLHQVSFFTCIQAQVLARIIVINNVQQGGKAAVVIEAALGVCPKAIQWGGAIAIVR